MNKETRPFSLEHARAGAPIRTVLGGDVEILKWDAPLYGDCPIIGLAHDEIVRWAESGEPAAARPSNYRLVMTPLGEIDGKPFFVGDEIEVFSLPDTWTKMPAEPKHKMRHEPEIRWPAPAKVYPTTQMSDDETYRALYSGPTTNTSAQCRRQLVNVALRHAIDNEQAITAEQHQQKIDDIYQSMQFAGFPINTWQETIDGLGIIKGKKEVVQAVKKAVEGRATRDMAIAEAVRDACVALGRERVTSLDTAVVMSNVLALDLTSIIEKVGK